MIFGDPNTFAVEIYHEPSSRRWRGFGRMCLHLQGSRLGRVQEEHCSLFHAVGRIAEVAAGLAALWDERFAGRSAEQVFGWIDTVLYLGIDGSQDKLWKFDFLTNAGEQFENYKCFVYCLPDGDVCIPYCGPDNVIRTPHCRAEEFRQVAADLEQWFKKVTLA